MEKPRLPPVVRGYPWTGSFFEMRRDPFDFLTRATREYGDVLRVRVGPFGHTSSRTRPTSSTYSVAITETSSRTGEPAR